MPPPDFAQHFLRGNESRGYGFPQRLIPNRENRERTGYPSQADDKEKCKRLPRSFP